MIEPPFKIGLESPSKKAIPFFANRHRTPSSLKLTIIHVLDVVNRKGSKRAKARAGPTAGAAKTIFFMEITAHPPFSG